MEFELTEELRELRERARHFVERELVPHELTVDEHEALPKEVGAGIRKALHHGLNALRFPPCARRPNLPKPVAPEPNRIFRQLADAGLFREREGIVLRGV